MLYIPPNIGARVLVRVENGHAHWRCDHTFAGADKPCGRTGACLVESWIANKDSVACDRCTVRIRRINAGSLKMPRLERADGTGAEYFRCTKLDLKQPRRSCGLMYDRFNASIRNHTGSACTKCEIGKVHSKGGVHPEALAIAMPVRAVRMEPEKFARCLSARCKKVLPVGRGYFCDVACRTDAYAENNYSAFPMADARSR